MEAPKTANQSLSWEPAIIRTLAYFDLFDYPLTARELWQWLLSDPTGVSFTDFKTGLAYLVQFTPRLQTARGFYFLSGRQDIVDSRLKRYLLAEKKFVLFLRMSRILAAIPFVRLVASCNTLAYSNSREEGDMDVFMVVQTGRIWTARFLGASLTQILGLRPQPNDDKDKICLSFWMSRQKMDLRPLSIERDIYMSYWLNQLVPVYSEKDVWQDFIGANSWLSAQLPNFLPYQSNGRRVLELGFFGRSIKDFGERLLAGSLGNWLEAGLKNFQLKRLPASLKDQANKTSAVVINDDILKFHDKDRRTFYRDRYEDKLRSLGLSIT